MMRKHLLLGLVLFAGIPLQAATLELVPKFGYGIHAPRDLAGPQYDRFRFENQPLVGLSVGYLTQENGEMEIAWSHSNTVNHLDQAAGRESDIFDVSIDQIHFNGLFMVDPAPTQRYILLGVGVTHYAAERHTDHTRFSFAAGGGVKWLWNDHLGLRFEGKWMPVLAPSGTHLFCPDTGTGGCPSTENNTFLGKRFPFVHTFEFTTGLMLRI